ncbi:MULTISPECIES: reprolysin-like metallopeptidase [Flavobacteriaceae]|uniref:reprolysin-like metallopeptidase n=1 Tax=Flavobacteriaceae TaxID=49546 RepID=UPI001FE66AC7|nr:MULTISPECIES: zinc-dependent metalloprotease family protein [Allomuricauda]MDC6366128.1 zinc-dependent metalloprotease family protein [Muricauda sp. AC10]
MEKARAVFSLDKSVFSKELQSFSKKKGEKQLIYLPNNKGEIIAFAIRETPVLSESLAAKYPNIKSYTGVSVNGEYKVKLSSSHKGVQTMIVGLNNQGTAFMEKISNMNDAYVLYEKGTGVSGLDAFVCKTSAIQTKIKEGQSTGKTVIPLVDDQLLRKFRIAVSASGEYTDFHGGTVADALAAINATITRVNEVFETDLGVTLELVPNNELVIFTDPDTDPYNGNLNGEVQNTLTTTIGEENYDVGHLFHKVDEGQDNGNAGFIGAVCVDNQKGSAFSSAFNPKGDTFDVDYVAHELGHQFGANHTWSFESEGTGVQAEPASGTTIMGYAGIVGANNVAPNGDDYFHYNSILQISNYLETTTCAETTALTNSPPTIVTPVDDFIIPKGTAFVLEGNASDPDVGDVLTYTWEQIDNGIVTTNSFGPENSSGANFRSLPPTTSPQRYFPKLSEVVQGNLTQTNPLINEAWETVSNVERDMRFAMTVRDNAAGGGQVVSDLLDVKVVNAAGPFLVTSQASSEVYEAGSTQEITWDVANTNILPVNALAVDIFLSLDGGVTFPVILADDTLNDGSEEVLMPGDATTNARIMVKASNNIFFAVNAADFSIQQSQVVLGFQELSYEVCQPDDLVIPFTYETFGGFSETSTFSADVPVGLTAAFSPTQANTNDTSINLTLSNTDNVSPGVYQISVISTSASVTKEVDLSIAVRDTGFSDVVLLAPTNGEASTSVDARLEWEANELYTSYDVEIADDVGFTSIVESATVPFNFYNATSLEEQTEYFWRVRPNNNCGIGTFGAANSFTTIQLDCNSFNASGVPLEISTVGTPTISSTIQVFEDLPITDVNVGVELNHTYLEDLIISLISPSGTRVTLISNSCGDLNDVTATFDDDGVKIQCSGSPAISETVQPLGSLASLNGESSLGEWTLEIQDTAASDGGSFTGFSLEICVEGAFRPDEDEDGVFDDGDDLCLGTPKGVEVDTNGCPVNRFATDNFQIEIQSESCRDSNDGFVTITPLDTSIAYSAVLDGGGTPVNVDFTDGHTFENLTAGSYTLCINGINGTITYQEACFTVVVTEPELLSAAVAVDSGILELTLEGGSLYNVELNGLVTQTVESKIQLPLQAGTNTLRAYTNLSCQGTYEETFFFSSKPILYPNPVDDETKIFLNGYIGAVTIEVFSGNGQLVMRDLKTVNGNDLVMDLSMLSTGTYYINIKMDGVHEIFKIIKQ